MAYKDVVCGKGCDLSAFVNARFDNNVLTLIRETGELVDLTISSDAISNLSKDPAALLDLINQALKTQSNVSKIVDGTTITANGDGKLTANTSGLASRLADGTTIKANNGKLTADPSGLADGSTIRVNSNGKLGVDTNALSSQIVGSTHRLVNSTGEVVLGNIIA